MTDANHLNDVSEENQMKQIEEPVDGAGSTQQLIALVALADEAPTAAELVGFLEAANPVVRRAAADALTESAPPDAGVALARLLLDDSGEVRATAIEGLRELREVLDADEAFAGTLETAVTSDDAAVRAAVVRLLREHRLGTGQVFVRAAADAEPVVRREAIAGLVSLDATDEIAELRTDSEPVVRLAVARGLATVGSPSGRRSLLELAADTDVRVRAAATEGLGTLGFADDGEVIVVNALHDDAWEVRKAAAIALGRAGRGVAAVPVLVKAVRDGNIDVRRAAVQSLTTWRDADPAARQALEDATNDPDADVRGYARLALT